VADGAGAGIGQHLLGADAGGQMAGADLAQGDRLGAGRDRQRAARREGAAPRQRRQRRHRSGDRGQPFALRPAGARDRGQKAAGIGMRGPREERRHRRLLDHRAGIHHGDVVGHLGNHAHVMGDEQDRHPHLGLQPPHQVEDLRLNGDVQRRRRFVRDQKLRRADQRQRDHRSLPHAAAELVRIGIEPAGGGGNLHHLEHLDDPGAAGGGVQILVQQHHFADLVADGEERVQRRHRFLKDHRYLAAADAAEGARRQPGQVQFGAVAGAIGQPAGGDAAVAGQKAQQRQRGHRLARARFADQRQGAAGVQPEADVAQRRDAAAAAAEGDAQPLDAQDRCRHGARRAAGARLAPITVSRGSSSRSSR
jgi:hypothetical protein